MKTTCFQQLNFQAAVHSAAPQPTDFQSVVVEFCTKYCSPGPNAIAPFFETKFARMEYVGANSFHLSFMRYTEEWVLLQPNLSLEECLSIIQSDPLFAP